MIAESSAVAGALRSYAAGQIVLASRQPTAHIVALAQPGSRVCLVDRLDGELLGLTLDELRRREIVVVTHDNEVSNHDLRRIVGDWWDRDKVDSMTTRRGESLREVVCLHVGDPSAIIREMGETFYTLAVVLPGDVPGVLDHLRPGAKLAIVNPELWAIRWAEDNAYRHIETIADGLVVMG